MILSYEEDCYLVAGLLKLAGVAVRPVKNPHSAISRLRAAKAESDRHNYAGKNAILQQLLREQPHNFHIDSRGDNGIVGLTHTSNFRIHMPEAKLPVKLREAIRS